MKWRLYLCILMLVVTVLPLSACKDEVVDPNAPPVTFAYDPGDSFITNVKQADPATPSKRYVKATVMIEVTDENGVLEMTERNYLVRDTILIVLRNVTEEEVARDEDLSGLQAKMVSALNEALGVEYVYSVYFSSFAIASA